MPRTDPLLLARAKQMRSYPTPAEARLWYLLRAKRFAHAKFSHQVIVRRAIVDFAACSRKLAIEIDGDTRIDAAHDARRTAMSERFGYRVLRFANGDVMSNLEGVRQTVSEALATAPFPTSPSARPRSPRWGEGE